MLESITVKIMYNIFPGPTNQLLEAITDTKRVIEERNYRLYSSPGYHRELCIDPILDALGFDEKHRVNFARKSSRIRLVAKDTADSLLVCTPPGDLPAKTDEIANSERIHFNAPGRWIITNGQQWRIHHPSPEIPTLDFTIDEPSAFWDLLIIGQSNHIQPEKP